MSLSLEIILGVVPEATSAWKPDSAPHMITMQTNGQTGPLITGPLPKNGVVAGIFSSGWTKTIPAARSAITPIFMYELRESRGHISTQTGRIDATNARPAA